MKLRTYIIDVTLKSSRIFEKMNKNNILIRHKFLKFTLKFIKMDKLFAYRTAPQTKFTFIPSMMKQRKDT